MTQTLRKSLDRQETNKEVVLLIQDKSIINGDDGACVIITVGLKLSESASIRIAF